MDQPGLRAGRGRQRRSGQPRDQRAELRRGPGRRRPVRRRVRARRAGGGRARDGQALPGARRHADRLPPRAAGARVARGRLERVELVPFRAAIAAGVGAVMTAHLAPPRSIRNAGPVRDSLRGRESLHGERGGRARATVPASMSPPSWTAFSAKSSASRGSSSRTPSTWGNRGPLRSQGEAAVRAILAGGDQVVKSPDTDAAIAGVREARRDGRSPEGAAGPVGGDASSRRSGSIPVGGPSIPRPVLGAWSTVRSTAPFAEGSRREAVTLVREAPGSCPCGARSGWSTWWSTTSRPSAAPGRALRRRAARRGFRPAAADGSSSIRAPRAGTWSRFSRPSRGDAVVLSLFDARADRAGQTAAAGRARRDRKMLSNAAGKPVVGVSFGNPLRVRGLRRGLRPTRGLRRPARDAGARSRGRSSARPRSRAGCP